MQTPISVEPKATVSACKPPNRASVAAVAVTRPTASGINVSSSTLSDR